MKTQRKKYSDFSSRLQSWDYGRPGYYFVTMTIQGRRRSFGEIRDGKMYLSTLGKFAEESWKNTAALRPTMNIRLDEFIVMPDHFHALLFIGDNPYNKQSNGEYVLLSAEEVTDKLLRPKNGFRPQAHNLASIVRGFKASVTTEARRQGIPFEWVSRFHDSVVRTVGDFFFVRSYIQTNVERWEGGI
jgi:REP element-mobilizing transposase RayT